MELTFQPRPYQLKILEALNKGTKRAVWVVHRRGGKDVTAFNWCILQLLLNPGWTAFHILPTYSQAKKVIWDSSTNDGKRILDYIPKELVESKNGQEMKIRFNNGSLYQLIGSDNIDSLVGSNPKIIIFSEYAIQSPAAWDYLRPILDVNKGYALFISTPRGKNHFFDLVNMARTSKDWFCEILPINQTGVLNDEEIQKMRDEGVSEEHIQQEFYCSFNRGVEGSYYGRLIEKAREEGRICNVPYETRSNVNTAWDIGYGDSTSITFWQEIGGEIRIIDFYEAQGEGIAHYAKIIQNKPYVYGTHYMPHDAGSGSIQTGRTLQDIAWEIGIKTTILQRESDIQIGIEAVRAMLSIVFIDQTKCLHLIKCLENYHKKFNEKTQSYSESPLHDWCFTGDTFVLTRIGMCQIMNLPRTGEVLTLCGWKQYTNPRITKKNAQLVEVKFVDGITVRCTPEHLFLTELGWKSAEHLTPYLEIQSSLMSLRNTLMGDYIDYGRMKHITHAAAKSFTEMFGESLLVKYLRNVIFITKMEMQRIICCSTLSVCQLPNTSPMNARKIQQSFHRKLEMQQQNGIDPMKIDYGIKGMQNAQSHGQYGKENRKTVYSAVRSLWQWLEKMVIHRNIATPTAKRLTIENVKPLDYKEDVWCMTVPDIEHFSLSNGAIVHNCSHAADSIRYMANARIQFGRGPGSMNSEKLNQLKANAGYGPKSIPVNQVVMQPFRGR